MIKESDELFFTRIYRRLNSLTYDNEEDVVKIAE